MAQAVILPKLGQATEESTIVKWLKKEGEPVRKGDILFEMETDKAVLEAESFFAGTLLKILVPEGSTVPVNTVVAYIGKPGESVPAAAPAPTVAKTPAPQAPGNSPVPGKPVATAAPAPVTAAPAAAPVAAPPPVAEKMFISPRARALVKKKGIAAEGIRGTGPNGRITEADVAAYLKDKNYDALRITPAAKQQAIREKLDILALRGTGEGGRIMTADVERAMAERPRPMSRMRQVIAQRLTQSVVTSPHFYVTVSADMGNIVELRRELKARQVSLTVTDFILEAVVLALQEFPVLNSVTDGKTIRWNSAVHLGVATSIPEGLVVPVIRNAQELALAGLHDAAVALAQKAREGRLRPDEMAGSTFTVSNMGMLNVESFTAIINPGEAAILAVSSTVETPVARDGKVVIRPIMKMTLSSDHRLVDGAMAAQFINCIKNKLEDMELWKRLT
jgi:pyruvate dehydrogenase E2 component (dihydrolipoamide acetyltransferase)